MSRVFQLCVFLIAVAGAPLLAEGPTPQEFKKASGLYQKGERSLKSGNLEAAREQFEKALAVVPAFPEACIGMGNLSMREQSFEDALAHYRRAHGGYAEMSGALMKVRQKRYSDARRQISALQDSISQLQTAFPAPVDLALKVSQLENSIQQLQAIEPPDPEAVEAPGEIHFYIGNALFRLGRIDEAIAAFETCREKSPKFAMVYNNLALVYWKNGRLDEARTSLSKAEELGFPVNPQFKVDLAAAR